MVKVEDNSIFRCEDCGESLGIISPESSSIMTHLEDSNLNEYNECPKCLCPVPVLKKCASDEEYREAMKRIEERRPIREALRKA